MTEALFQFIWQHSLAVSGNLRTMAGESISIISPGRLNRNAGPDFSEGKIKIGDTILVGNIELHIKSSDWIKHGHDSDPAFKNLILHVVYENDVELPLKHIPVMELKPHISNALLHRYEQLMHAPNKIPCSGMLHRVPEIKMESWFERLLAERWEEKLREWNVQLDQNAEDWRNLLYYRLAYNFGFKTNSAPFLELAKSIPLTVLGKCRTNLQQVEALLFGQAGFLATNVHDEYSLELRREYDYLRSKFKLTPIDRHLWKFLRMRPANFPTVRIAQFAKLIHQSEHLFSTLTEANGIHEMTPLLDVTASVYWNTHYRLGEIHEKPYPKTLGKDSIHNIIINTVAPITFLFGLKTGNDAMREKAISIMEQIPGEKNSILELWAAENIHANNAGRSQSLIQLYNNYCTKKNCTQCALGASLIREQSN